jgi:hypothetical protein
MPAQSLPLSDWLSEFQRRRDRCFLRRDKHIKHLRAKAAISPHSPEAFHQAVQDALLEAYFAYELLDVALAKLTDLAYPDPADLDD